MQRANRTKCAKVGVSLGESMETASGLHRFQPQNPAVSEAGEAFSVVPQTDDDDVLPPTTPPPRRDPHAHTDAMTSTLPRLPTFSVQRRHPQRCALPCPSLHVTLFGWTIAWLSSYDLRRYWRWPTRERDLRSTGRHPPLDPHMARMDEGGPAARPFLCLSSEISKMTPRTFAWLPLLVTWSGSVGWDDPGWAWPTAMFPLAKHAPIACA